MDGLEYIIPGAIAGIVTIITGAGTAVTFRRYKKSKKRYENAKKLSVLTAKEAANQKSNNKDHAFVEGWIEKVDKPEKILSFNYEKNLSLSSFSQEEHLLEKSYSPFNLTDKKGNKIYVAPSEKLRMVNLVRKEEKPSGWLNTVLYALLRGGLFMGTVEYFTYDGDFITLFGTLGYDPIRGRTALFPRLVSSSGQDDMLSYMKKESSVAPPILLGILCTISAGLTGFFAYKAYQARHPQPADGAPHA